MHPPPSYPNTTLFDELLIGLNVEGIEKSFKLTKNALFEQRALVGVGQISRHRKKIFNNCHILCMPEVQLQSFREHFPKANRIYFGYEQTPDHCTYKVYLEFWNQYAQNRTVDPTYNKPFMLYLGYKWDASAKNTQNTLTRYILYPEISLQTILEKIESIYKNHSEPLLLTLAQQIITSASKRKDSRLFKYLEVTEDNNPRKSFDINLYEAEIKIQNIYSELKMLQQHYNIDAQKFNIFYQSIKHQEFGHLSGGVNKSENDFMTFYYCL